MNISTIFLRAGVLALIAGIGIGMAMGITGHFEFRHAHAHTNLVGWASMMIYGFFYRLFPDAAAGLLPRIHAALAIPALVLMIAGALLIAGGDLTYLVVMVVGELIMAVSVLLFAYILFRATSAKAGSS